MAECFAAHYLENLWMIILLKTICCKNIYNLRMNEIGIGKVYMNWLETHYLFK